MNEITRTIVIYNEFGEGSMEEDPRGLAYFVFDGQDLRHLNLQFINSINTSDKDADRINELIYDENGEYQTRPYTRFPIDQIHDKTAVVEFGILP